MIEFTCALAVFIVSHRLPTTARVRGWLVARMGETIYRGFYSFLSLVILVWLISAALRAPVIMLWWPQAWHAAVPLVLMPFSAVLITSAALSPNPLSVNLRSVTFDREHPGIVSVTRHPMLWGFALWALSHLIANGDLVSAVLFGGLAAFALYGMRILDHKTKARLGDAEWHRLADDTSVLPFGAVLIGRKAFDLDRRLALGILIGVALYVWFVFQGHEILIGADPLASVAT